MKLIALPSSLISPLPTLAAIAGLLILSPLTQGRQAEPAKAPPKLADTVIEIESLGLSLRLPENALVTKKPQEAQRLIVEANDRGWIGTLEILESSSESQTAKSVLDRLVEQTRTYDTKMRITDQQSLTVDGKDVEFAVARLNLRSGNDRFTEVRAFGVMKPSPKMFAIYGVRGDGSKSDEIIELALATIRSIEFEDPAKRAEQVAKGIAAMEGVLGTITEQTYRQAIAPDSWYRVYEQDGEGRTQEIAFYRVQESIGPKSAVGAGSSSTTTSAEQGLLVRQIARYVSPESGEPAALVVEIENEAWSSLDRKSEMWSTRQIIYRKHQAGFEVSSRSTITGVRDHGRISVSVTTSDQNTPDPTFTVPTAYLAQSEQHMLYRLLVPRGTGTYYLYQFRPQTLDLKRREEVITEEGNFFKIESRPDPIEAPTIKTVDERGRILKMVDANGQITEPTTPQEVQRLWKAAGLPTGAITPVPRPVTRP